MGLFRKNQVVQPKERRTSARYSVDCAATLKMLGGDRKGRLSDLSEAGARLETADPPTEGVSGLLSWNGHEHFGKIVWANEKSCGIVFERPIPLAVVEETIETVEAPTGPVANFGNIPLGQRRSRRTSLVSGD